MGSSADFQPDWASAPGETIADILSERHISTADLAHALALSADSLHDLIQGHSTITLATARALRGFLGGSLEFWMSRDLQYRDDVTTLNASNHDWLSQLPLADMIRFGWLGPTPHPTQELDACLRFFGVNSVREWHHHYADLQQAIAFRTSPSYDSQPKAVAAWLRQGEHQAMASSCAPWNAVGFQSSLSEIRTLTKLKDPRIFVPKLCTHCARHGVAVAVVRTPAGCRASGATRFLSTGRALLILSFRHLTDDHFWFTFFHEAGHLLLHQAEKLFLEDTTDNPTECEREANEFAARVLLPDGIPDSLRLSAPSPRLIIKFAHTIRMPPGIVVGQMQHHRIIRHNQLNRLKRRYRWTY